VITLRLAPRSFGIPDIGGQPAKVMKYTRDENPPTPIGPRGYLCHHGMSPNGGGTNVNQFTMILDFMIPDLHQGDNYNTVVKWEAVDDWNVDGSISIRANDIGGPNTGGIGISGQYTGDGTTWIIGGQWQRLVVAVDMVADPGTITYYLDGVRFGQMTSGDRWGFDRRHAIPQVVRMYGDGEADNEVNTVYVNSLQFREGTMTAEQALALGAATASGIPIPPNPVKGHWDFDQGDLRATVGTDLQYGDAPGETAMRDHTSFGTTTSFGIPDIGGQPAKVMKYTRDENPPTPIGPRGYLCRHGIAPNGGGTNVNQFTMLVDFMIPDLHQGDNYNTVVKWEAVDDWNVDGSISIRANDIGGPNTGGIGISGQYTGDGNTWIIGGKWQRLAVAVDMVADPGTITYYLDGVRFGQMTSGDRWGFDRRHAIPPVVRMYGDGEADNEVNTVYVNSLQFRDGTMTDDQVLALGAATAAGIPIPLTSNTPQPTPQPTLAYSRTGTTVTITWNSAVTGYNLEGVANLSAPIWAPVPNVTNNSVTIASGAGNQFFRLKKP
jgi:hypothetical protein